MLFTGAVESADGRVSSRENNTDVRSIGPNAPARPTSPMLHHFIIFLHRCYFSDVTPYASFRPHYFLVLLASIDDDDDRFTVLLVSVARFM